MPDRDNQGEDLDRLNADLPRDIMKRLRMYAAEKGMKIREVLIELLDEHLPNYVRREDSDSSQ